MAASVAWYRKTLTMTKRQAGHSRSTRVGSPAGAVIPLRRYWLRFAEPSHHLPPGFGYGCGVTAYDYEDALTLLRERVFHRTTPPDPVEVIEDVDISKLDPGHVLPNMEEPTTRGIWFPRGYR